ncbi:hypothetical protein M3J09_003677 [Ascochyta lentis]
MTELTTRRSATPSYPFQNILQVRYKRTAIICHVSLLFSPRGSDIVSAIQTKLRQPPLTHLQCRLRQ